MFVLGLTGTIALLWSAFPNASAAEIKLAVTRAIAPRRTTVVSPLLDAWAAYQVFSKTYHYSAVCAFMSYM